MILLEEILCNQKFFLLSDCQPNVPVLLETYFTFTKNILIKLAPVLDISQAINQLKFVKKVHIIAVQNEVKELLFELEKNYNDSIEILALNYQFSWQKTTYIFNSIPQNCEYSLPLQYLFEPNAALLKSGGFEQIASIFKVYKLHIHSHLYTHNENVDFQGRAFKIVSVFDYNKSNMKQFLENTKANITTRNFPESVENLRKKHKIKPGGESYCFFTTNLNNKKIVLICQKI